MATRAIAGSLARKSPLGGKNQAGFEISNGTRDGTRTRMSIARQILSLLRLPIPPPGHFKGGAEGGVKCHRRPEKQAGAREPVSASGQRLGQGRPDRGSGKILAASCISLPDL